MEAIIYYSTIIPKIKSKSIILMARLDYINLQCDRNNDINYNFAGVLLFYKYGYKGLWLLDI